MSKRLTGTPTPEHSRPVLINTYLMFLRLQLAQNREARLALHCNQRADINTMHASLSWLKVEERLTASRLIFLRKMNVLKIPNCFQRQLTHSSDTHTYPTRHATRGLFTVPKSRTNSRKRTVLYSKELHSISYCSN